MENYRIVFILGAGAAVPGGCPVMNNFFECAEVLSRFNKLGNFNDDNSKINAFRALLAESNGRSHPDLDNLEAVFNGIEMAEFLGKLPEAINPTPGALKAAMTRVIAAVLERTQSLGHNGNQDRYLQNGPPPDRVGRRVGPEGYDDIARFACTLRSGSPKYDVSFITFNYDVGLEYALAARGMKVGYGFAEGSPALDQIPVHKLHGSVNWYTKIDDSKKKVHYIPLPDIATASEPFHSPWPYSNPGDRQHVFMSKYWIEGPGVECPYIVPPSEGKFAAREILSSTWKSASEHLFSADYVVVIGYSIPRTDEFFRQLYKISSMRSRRLRKFYLIDPQATTNRGPDSLYGRYESLIGPYAPTLLTGYASGVEGGLQSLYQKYSSCRGIL